MYTASMLSSASNSSYEPYALHSVSPYLAICASARDFVRAAMPVMIVSSWVWLGSIMAVKLIAAAPRMPIRRGEEVLTSEVLISVTLLRQL